MALITRFETPAALRDLPAESPFYQNWHDFVSAGIPESTPGAAGVGEYYNASLVDVAVLGERALTWMAFPRRVLMPLRDDRRQVFVDAENRDSEDEYCEWRVTRNPDGKITKIIFTTESPEYWEQLWVVDRNRVVELYRELTGDPAVVESDLHDGSGNYLRRNPWNETATGTDKGTIVHLIQRINTLSAALGLAISSAAQTSAGMEVVNDNYEELGLPNTSVDPRVELDISTLVRKGLSVALRDPIGLYIAGWDDTGFAKPNGKPIGDYWTIERGRPGQVLRLKFEVPPKEGFVVGDIRIGGRPIEFGGQVAEHVTVTIVGTAGQRVAEPAVSSRAASRGVQNEASQVSPATSSVEGTGYRRRGRR